MNEEWQITGNIKLDTNLRKNNETFRNAILLDSIAIIHTSKSILFYDVKNSIFKDTFQIIPAQVSDAIKKVRCHYWMK